MTGINRRDKKLKYNSAAIWTILNFMSYLKICLQIAEMSGTWHTWDTSTKKKTSWLTQCWSLDKIKHGLPCGDGVCFPGSIFHIVGIEPGISWRRQPSIWNALEKHSPAHKLSARVELSSRLEAVMSVHESQPLISLTFCCRTKISRNTCIHIWSIAASVYYTTIGHDSIRIER